LENCGGGQHYKVLSSLEQAKQVGFRPIKIGMDVLKGINDLTGSPALPL
jgi:molybdenum cofactor biosynthesis enzyme MoaA